MASNEHLAGKVVVVTGAAAGVGRAIALRFAREGAKLGLISRDKVALELLAEELRAAGAQDVAIAPIDVSDANEVFAAADRFAGELGPINIWVNDAMVTVFSLVGDITPEEFRRVTEVTYLGVVYGSMAALKQMRTQPSRPNHQHRLGARLPWHPAAIRILRSEARDPGLYRLVASRARARTFAHRRLHSRTAGDEYPAIRLGSYPSRASAQADGNDLPARGRCGGGPTRSANRRERILGGNLDAPHDCRQHDRAEIHGLVSRPLSCRRTGNQPACEPMPAR